MFLLDTNVVSEQRKLRPHGAVVGSLSSVQTERIYVSAMTVAEIQTGVELTRLQDASKAAEIEARLLWMISTTKVLPIDAEIAREWARMIHGQSRVLAEDAWIAATAKCRHLTLATRNTKDFTGFGIDLFNPFDDTRQPAPTR